MDSVYLPLFLFHPVVIVFLLLCYSDCRYQVVCSSLFLYTLWNLSNHLHFILVVSKPSGVLDETPTEEIDQVFILRISFVFCVRKKWVSY